MCQHIQSFEAYNSFLKHKNYNRYPMSFQPARTQETEGNRGECRSGERAKYERSGRKGVGGGNLKASKHRTLTSYS